MARSRRKDVSILRFCLSPGDAAKLFDLEMVKESALPDIRDFTASYYDFSDQSLKSQGYSLSIEKATRRRRRQIVRKTAADFAPGAMPDEYTVFVRTDEPGWSAFENRPYEAFLPAVPDDQKLYLLFTVRVKRYSWTITAEGAGIQMTLDT